MDHQEHLAFLSRGKITVHPWSLRFIHPARTSRNVLKTHPVYFIQYHSFEGDLTGISECAPIIGLSAESNSEVEAQLQQLVNIDSAWTWIELYQTASSSVRFAMELLLRSVHSSDGYRPFREEAGSVPINGLVWMNEIATMLEEGIQKWQAGFHCVKFKVGAFDFDDELNMLKAFRKKVGEEVIIRLDANGAWDYDQALRNIERLAPLRIHSIEQPIKKGSWSEMRKLCQNASIQVALDEELIGCTLLQMDELIEEIRPPFLVLKPSLHGGFEQCEKWIQLAKARNLQWWATSALESNIGLNAIYRWVSQFQPTLHQGLGTGALYDNNWESPLMIKKGALFSNDNISWRQPW